MVHTKSHLWEHDRTNIFYVITHQLLEFSRVLKVFEIHPYYQLEFYSFFFSLLKKNLMPSQTHREIMISQISGHSMIQSC